MAFLTPLEEQKFLALLSRPDHLNNPLLGAVRAAHIHRNALITALDQAILHHLGRIREEWDCNAIITQAVSNLIATAVRERQSSETLSKAVLHYLVDVHAFELKAPLHSGL